MFEWKPEYSVQLPEIDAQHQQLFALAAELHAAMSLGQGKAAMEKSLARLVDYTKTHFAAEEQLMRKYGFPESEVHGRQHQTFTAKVIEFQKGFLRQEAWLTVDLMIFLQNWLSKHILGCDKKYAEHIRRRTAA